MVSGEYFIVCVRDKKADGKFCVPPYVKNLVLYHIVLFVTIFYLFVLFILYIVLYIICILLYLL